MRLGIDGSNLRQGGGITHLVQLLGAADPAAAGITRVTVWGAPPLLDLLPDRGWLHRVADPALDGHAASRAWWQHKTLAARASAAADVLFSPGGTYLGAFHPFVTMFRNMLPFDAAERARYGVSAMRVKLEILRRAQAATFRRAGGVIFLTEHARRAVAEAGVRLRGRETVIPHGLDPRFLGGTRGADPLAAFGAHRPFRWLYVSAIHEYKHQWNVVEAAAMLRVEGLPVALDIVGPAHPASGRRLDETVNRVDPARTFVTLNGGRAHAELPALYRAADAFVFASTCENMPNSLVEAMAAGLPIVCSDRAPMPEILGDGGVYCDPLTPASIAAAMKQIMTDVSLRTRGPAIAQARARAYSWERCAHDTFAFLASIGSRAS
jgi:glycosyltransferase involved in cell wall biosynthesis